MKMTSNNFFKIEDFLDSQIAELGRGVFNCSINDFEPTLELFASGMGEEWHNRTLISTGTENF